MKMGQIQIRYNGQSIRVIIAKKIQILHNQDGRVDQWNFTTSLSQIST